MCGISGILNFQQPVDPVELSRFNAALTHRGPDFQATAICAEGYLGLGHCRLSIIDTAASANQPFVSDDRRFWLTFNGEIYNYLELREELTGLGIQFRTASDTEVILAAYRQWGQACLHRFNGMWAFALWDEQTQQLFVARDRFGVKPFYYRKNAQQFAFASEQKAFARLNTGLDISPQMASRLMMFPEAVESSSETLYHNLDKLLPGESALIVSGQMHKRRWWNTYETLKNADDSAPTAEELAENFSQACMIRTRADVKLATALSGGLDSSAVTAKVAGLSGVKESKQLKVFVGSFEDEQADEFQWAKHVIDEYQLDYHRVRISTDDAITRVAESCKSLEDLNELPVIGQWLLYQAMHDEGYKVSLEGHGGDELLGGYHRHLNAHLGDLLRARRAEQLPELARTIKALSEARPAAGSAFVRGNILQAPLNSKAIHAKLAGKRLYLRNLMAVEDDFSPDIVHERQDSDYSQQTLLFQKLYEDFHYFSLPYILRNYDRMSMANSVEVRSPFLDYRFVLSAFAAGAEHKLSGGVGKSLLRRDFSFIPEAIRQRTDKSGFTPPLKRWMAEDLGRWTQAFVAEQSVQNTSLFDGVELRRLVDTHVRAGQFDKVAMYWPMINLALLDRGTREFAA